MEVNFGLLKIIINVHNSTLYLNYTPNIILWWIHNTSLYISTTKIFNFNSVSNVNVPIKRLLYLNILFYTIA